MLAADFQSIGKLDHGSLRPETSSRQLVRRADAVNVFDSGQNFEVADIKIDTRSDRSHHGLPCAGGAMHREAHLNQVFYHPLDLLLRGRFLHCDNHRKASSCLALSF